MRRREDRRELEYFVGEWPADARYWIWGTSNTANYLCDCMGGAGMAAGFIDSNPEKWGAQFHGKPVLSWEACKKESPHCKVIVASAAYPEIRDVLRKNGLEELRDFCDSRYFLSAHGIMAGNKLYLARTDLSVTECCNLRCKHCNMLMPYFARPKHRELARLKSDIDAYFRWVDRVQIFNLLGGEPFLYPDIFELTRYLSENYGSRIHQLAFFSNGTVLPDEKLLDLMSQAGIEVQISDYRVGLPRLANQIDAVQAALKARGIPYRHGVDERWVRFGFPDYRRPADWSGDPVSFFDECYAPFRGLYQKRLYYCHLEASAEAAGLFTPSVNDYFDLSAFEESRKADLAEFDLGYTQTGDISYCARCKGCFSVNQDYIPVAEQRER